MDPDQDLTSQLTPSQQHVVQVAVDQLHDFKAGFLFIEHIREELGEALDPYSVDAHRACCERS